MPSRRWVTRRAQGRTSAPLVVRALRRSYVTPHHPLRLSLAPDAEVASIAVRRSQLAAQNRIHRRARRPA